MRSKVLFHLLLLGVAFTMTHRAVAQPVPPLQVMNYLKQKIKVFYVHAPGMAGLNATTQVHQLSTEAINSNTNGVVFGTGGNNRMSTSAQLLLSIFKSREGRGNGLLQDFLYNLIKIKDKPISLYFFNDAMEPLSEHAATWYYLDTVRKNDELSVWPATWGTGLPNEAGCINLGENFFAGQLPLLQLTLLELVTSLQLNSERPLHPGGCWHFTHRDYDPSITFYMYTSVMDKRFITDQAVCAAIVNTFDTAFQRRLYRWFQRPSMAVRRTPRTGTFSGEDEQYWLTNARSEFARLPESFGELDANNTPGMRAYAWLNFSSPGARTETAKKYQVQNEISEALLFNSVIRLTSLPSFLTALKNAMADYNPAGNKSKFVWLLEKMCLQAMNGSTPAQVRANPPRDKRYLLPIAIIDILSGRNDEFTYESFSSLAGPGFSRELFDLYSSDVKASVRGITTSGNNPDRWYDIRNALQQLLNP